MTPPEVGGRVVLALLDNRAADGAGSGEQIEQGPQRIARWSAVRSSEKRWSISSTASLFDRKT